jgi:hypothetical protein
VIPDSGRRSFGGTPTTCPQSPLTRGFTTEWEFEFYTLDVDPLVLERGSSPATVGHTALIREKGYSQRWMSETSYSTTKRSLGSAVRAQFWYREFREIVLMFAISNIEQICESL